MVGYQGNDSSKVTRSYAPKMKVWNSIAGLLKSRGYTSRKSSIGGSVEENRTRRASKGPRPTKDYECCYESHYRVQPDPSKLPPCDKADDDHYRNRRISHYMDECST